MAAPAARLFCALDTVDLALARHLARQLGGLVDGVKLGLEFFTANGPAGVRAIQEQGLPIFLDLKFHDIPNTVAGGMSAAAALGVAIITVHASGGGAMLAAAIAAARQGAAASGVVPPKVVGITVLTSLGEDDLVTVGQHGPLPDQAQRLADLSLASGLDGIVCSAREAALLRKRLGPTALLVVPGLRPVWSEAQDQKRVVTPGDAVRLGADVLVVGRPITTARDPADAARRIVAEMRDEAVSA
ncbi:MAG: orotidine-5'-phosphate decarboxylase [Proteobacteria bacterium]|nr:orotidine-5'-phosphate decarboxylase [Pseudomonadota bacterium]